MIKKYLSHSKLHEQILQGVNELTEKVALTLGPKGQNVILHPKGLQPFITKDGVTVARFIDFENPFKNAAAQIIKQAAQQTNSACGDGTTTSTVLANAILNKAQRYLAAGAVPIELKRGMDKTVEQVVHYLKDNSKFIESKEDIKHIATISSNGDENIGELIATAVDKVGKDGSVTIDKSRSTETVLNVIEGFRIDSGFVSQEFVTDERMNISKFNNPLILVTDEKIEFVEQLLPILELVAREKRPFIIIADEVSGQALAACVHNAIMSKQQGMGGMKINVIKSPKYGQERRNIMKDLALSIGATYVSREHGLKIEETKLTHLGSVKFAESNKNGSIFVGGLGDYKKIEDKIQSLKEEIKQTEDLSECERIQERITRLASGVAIISVGGFTDVEVTEKKHRIEDALEAVKSAQAEGILPGGGTALFKISQILENVNFQNELSNEDQKLGCKIILEAIKEPFKQILRNAKLKVDVLENEMSSFLPFNKGYNVVKEEFVDMCEEGIVDPAKVTRHALQNASSVASSLIMSNCAIIEE